MYLIDTNVVSEARKGARANSGVRAFFASQTTRDETYVSVVTVGELQRGIERIRHRGDISQAARLEDWPRSVSTDYADHVLAFDAEAAQVWGRLRVPDEQHALGKQIALDKQIAATALIYDLTVVTRNEADFTGCGLRLLNPFGIA